MGQTNLTPAQKKMIKLVASESALADFYLTGGTALSAYYLKHRVSDDLDFFTFGETEKIFLHAFSERAKGELNAAAVRFSKLYDRNQFFFQLDDQELKVEFTQ